MPEISSVYNDLPSVSTFLENESQELFKNIKKYSLQQKKSSCNVETLTMERSVNKKLRAKGPFQRSTYHRLNNMRIWTASWNPTFLYD